LASISQCVFVEEKVSGVNEYFDQAWRTQGTRALKKAGRAGRKPRLQPARLEQLRRGLKQGPEVLGYGTGLWTTWRVADLIERQMGQKFHPGHVSASSCGECLAELSAIS
jgi:transposase